MPKIEKRYRKLVFLVWFLTGFWHGASWNYVLWGLYFFVFIAFEKLFLKKWLDKMPALFSHLYLLLVVFFGWILFKYEQLADGWLVLKGLFGLNGNGLISGEARIVLLNYLFFMIVAVIAATSLGKRLMARFDRAAEYTSHMALTRVNGMVRVVVPIVLLFLSTMALVGNSYNPFLYFQF